jgi:hypothetical protein
VQKRKPRIIMNMITLKRTAVYLITFLVFSCAAIALIDWQRLDKDLVIRANESTGNAYRLNTRIIPINIPNAESSVNEGSVDRFRQSLVAFLNAIIAQTEAGKKPDRVVLDYWFDKSPQQIENIKGAILRLKALKVPVYASYKLEVKGNGGATFEEIDAAHNSELYNEYLAGSEDSSAGAGRYHTLVYGTEKLTGGKSTSATYESDVRLAGAFDSVLIGSLVRKVVMDLNESSASPEKLRGSIIPYQSLDGIDNRVYDFVPDSTLHAGRFRARGDAAEPIGIGNKILVAGDMDNDVIDRVDGRDIPGPYVVARALSDLLENNAQLKLPVDRRSLVIGQILFFSLFTTLIFALLFKYVKRLQTKPGVIAVLAFLSAMVFFFAYYEVLISFNRVVPIGNTIAASLVAAGLAWHFAHKFLVTGLAEGSQKYDVFISYSHSQSDWTYKNVYEPLAAFRKPNGDKLNIFFDKKSIGIGEAFTAKYMWAIVDTKYFVPVFSDDYYSKNHCKNEMDCAMKRCVEKLLAIQPIAFSFKAIPEAYATLNCLDITAQPDFIERIKENLSAQ